MGRRREIGSGGIEEGAYHRLGGLEQWVLIRGESVGNPPLVVLHGGPGISETALFSHYNRPLEKAFTVVHWDQRGAGKSFDPAIPRSSLTVEQLVSDLDELVEVVRRRLGRERIAILGHSWGTVLGPLYAHRFPQKVMAYVGAAQIGDWAASERASYAYALGEAERLGRRGIAKKLRAIGPPPHSADELWTQRTCLSRLDGQMSPRALWKILRAIAEAPESSLLEAPRTMKALRFSLEAMWDEVSRLNLLELVPSLAVPCFFFLGRHDHWVPNETSLAYIDRLRAPSKELVWFEESGHEAFVDEPEKFNAAMLELVRPHLA
ncbi:MAG: alpha/beta fold hydrolase [Solirubrobacterales bacterium]